MKGLLRIKAVQQLLALIVASYVELVISTVRWRYEGREAVDAAMAKSEGAIGLFWHGRIVQAMACRPLLRDKPRRVMISLSRDGEFIAKAAEILRIPAIRGSTARNRGANAKGGATAFRQAIATIKAGGVVIVTPDGPRGPNEIFSPGPIRLAAAAGCPVFLMGLAAKPAFGLRTWDRMRIPLPFARAVVVLQGPLRAPERANEASAQILSLDWGAKLRAAQALAESLL
jgi:lysophospholipid acyltransferase (LPLAT)-like uncharacterized protein